MGRQSFLRILPWPVDGGGRDPVAFLEAHPRVRAADLADAIADGLNVCVWRWPDDGAIFAQTTFSMAGEGHVRLITECKLAIGHQQNLTVEVHKATNYTDKREFSLFGCPRCDRRCQHLVLTWVWSCDICSGLPYRSQRVGSKIAAWELRDRLEHEVGAGRPKGMHHRTYSAKRQQLDNLRRRLQGSRAEAPLEYLHTLVSAWSSLPEPQDQRDNAKNEVPRIISPPRGISPWLGGTPDEL